MIMIDIPIYILLRLIIVSLILIILILIYLSYKRKLQDNGKEKIRAYLLEKEDRWYDYLVGNIQLDDRLIPKDVDDIVAIERIFLSYIKNLSSSSIRKNIKSFSNEYLSDYYKKLLHSKKWSIRMNALYRINDFHIDSLLDICGDLPVDKLSMEENYELLAIYSKFDRHVFLSEISNLTIDFSEYEYKKLLLALEVEILKSLMEIEDRLPLNCQYAIVDVLAFKKDLDYVPYLESSLDDNNPEIRIRSLKAINEIGFINDFEKYKKFFDSHIWEERLMMAKLFDKFPFSYVELYLEKYLEDESWLVRQQTLDTINKLKSGKVREKVLGDA